MESNEIFGDIIIWLSGPRMTSIKIGKKINDIIMLTTSNMMPGVLSEKWSFSTPDVSPNDARFAITCLTKPYRS